VEYVYTALLLHKAGKPIIEENITKVMTSAGIKVDPTRVKALVAALSEINIDEALKSSVNIMPPAQTVSETKPELKTEEEKEEEKEEKDEKKEEEALEGLGALFG
jgi:large subunit ribosomal protein L12